ncbi:MaoC family dehydratase N-terminal domain-containing protein [Cupriavidus oxalaticus]|uniref:MaoC family dehydratase n=1 Tax=Cupriavidus oxalaticus TaxID=96344 RepID=A0A5P3VTR9_9BURK|nr:MaoC family dehydratase N-terminal domain-containing protein [Cupriavidus oxalaticus]QEZ48923.1 MaoC family dehydratase [Cupriavidus oxalaticus]
MADKSMIGVDLGKGYVDVEKGQLRFFAKATGETNPIYVNEEAAKAAGYPSLPAPPTFLFSLNAEAVAQSGVNRMKVLQLDLGRILHAEQSFELHKMVFAGDRLHFENKLTNVYDKKNGALHFIVSTTTVTNQKDEHVADLLCTLVERRG